MKLEQKLIKGVFKKRYKRFFADVEVDGQLVTAHVPNTGSMKTCLQENAPCWLTHNPDPKRKLHWTLERMVIDGAQIGVNTRIPNNLVFEAWENGIVPHWKNFDRAQLEVKINAQSRLDLALWNSKEAPQDFTKLKAPFENLKLHFVEVKNVTMAMGSTAYFPDAVTSRGAKHIEELLTLQDLGHTCEMVFVIHRENITDFAIAKDIDPTYNTALLQAQKKGLQVTALLAEFDKDQVQLTRLLK